MRIALAQIDTVVGGVEVNLERVSQALSRAREESLDLVAFPELALTGYPLLDLVYRRDFLARQKAALERVAERARGITAIVGFVDHDPSRKGKDGRDRIYNAAAVVRDGRVLAVHRKILLPSYDVFFEGRYFTPGDRCTVVDVNGVRVGIEVCEDLWDEAYEFKVTRALAEQGAQVVVNISASPFHLDKGAERRELVRRHVRETGRPICLVNQVGGEDGYEGELVFDGDSFAVDAKGRTIAVGKRFEPDFVVVEIDPESGEGTPCEDAPMSADEQAFLALASGVRSYAQRSGFSEALIGLSGGIDSALVAAVAAEALGPSKVTGVSMPSRYSSEHSKDDARQLAESLGIRYRVIPIEPVFEAYLQTLAPAFEGTAPDVTEENLQARVRGGILMALSNKFGSILLSTGNKTEVALGYCTLYGDMCGGLIVLSDVSKSRVYSVSRDINQRAGREIIPWRTIEKPPSAELREGQVDPFDYDIVSPLTDMLVEEELTIDECVARGYDRTLAERLDRLIRVSEYKRRQAAPGIKITERAFGVGRRMPIA